MARYTKYFEYQNPGVLFRQLPVSYLDLEDQYGL